MPYSISIESGPKITSYTSTFPARRYWYQIRTVTVDGVKLKGHVQVRHRQGRTDVITCYENSCVLGQQIDWMIRMNTDILPI